MSTHAEAVARVLTQASHPRGLWTTRSVVLAPMAGYSDAPFRRLARAFGADWAVSEMVSARGLLSGDKRGLGISAPYPDERRLSIQLFSSDPSDAAAAAEMLVARYQPDALDLNMGCPVKKIAQRGCGAELIRDPDRAAAVVAAMVAAVGVPITAKTRLGYLSRDAAHVMRAVVAAGARGLAVHGRTAAEKYSGSADWSAIARMTEGLGVPVLASGDVASADDVRALRAMGLGAMVGRGAMGQPWIFRTLQGGDAPTREAVVAMAWRHARDQVQWYGSERALLRLRPVLAQYAEHAGAPREPFLHVSTLDDIAHAWMASVRIDPRSDANLALDPLLEEPALTPRREATDSRVHWNVRVYAA